MKPAGLERKIEHQMVPSGGGGKAYERILPTVTSSGVGGVWFWCVRWRRIGGFRRGESFSRPTVWRRSTTTATTTANIFWRRANWIWTVVWFWERTTDAECISSSCGFYVDRAAAKPVVTVTSLGAAESSSRQIGLRPTLIPPIRSAREISQSDRFQINRLPPSIVPRYSIRSNKVHVEDL